MTDATANNEVLRLGTREWIWLIVLISSAAVGNVYSYYNLSLTVHERIDDLDRRWQKRVVEISKDIKQEFHAEIDEVKEGIPPRWFRVVVDKNSEEIEKLKERLREKQ